MKQLLLLCLLAVSSEFAAAQSWVTERYFKNGVPEAKNFLDTIKYELKLAQGKLAPNLVYQRHDNDAWDSLVTLRGKIVLISSWQTGCAPCVKELPDLATIQAEYEKEGVVLLCVSPENKERQQKFFEKNKINIGGIKATMLSVNYVQPFLTMVIPTGFIIDRQGVIRDSWAGPQTYESLKKRLDPIISEK